MISRNLKLPSTPECPLYNKGWIYGAFLELRFYALFTHGDRGVQHCVYVHTHLNIVCLLCSGHKQTLWSQMILNKTCLCVCTYLHTRKLNLPYSGIQVRTRGAVFVVLISSTQKKTHARVSMRVKMGEFCTDE